MGVDERVSSFLHSSRPAHAPQREVRREQATVEKRLRQFLHARDVSDADKRKAIAEAHRKGTKKGLFGKVLDVIDLPRAAVVSGLKELNDLRQDMSGQGDDDSASFGDWLHQTGEHYGFGQYIEDEGGKDLPMWAKRALGFVGDVAFDPLTYATFGAGTAVESGARLSAKELARLAAEKYGAEGAAELVARIGEKGAAGLSKAELADLGAQGGVRAFVPGSRTAAKLSGGRIPARSVEILSHDLTRQGVGRLAGAANKARSAERVAQVLSKVGGSPDKQRLLKAFRSGNVEEALPALTSLDKFALGRSRGVRFAEEMTDELRPVLGKFRKKAHRTLLRKALEGDEAAAAALRAVGLDHEPVRAWLDRVRQLANDELGEDWLGDIADYFPHLRTREAARKLGGRSQSFEGLRKISPEYARKYKPGDKFLGEILEGTPNGTVSVDEMQGIVNRVIKNPSDRVKLFTDDPLEALPAYARMVGQQLGERRALRDIREAGVIRSAIKTEGEDIIDPANMAEAERLSGEMFEDIGRSQESAAAADAARAAAEKARNPAQLLPGPEVPPGAAQAAPGPSTPLSGAGGRKFDPSLLSPEDRQFLTIRMGRLFGERDWMHAVERTLRGRGLTSVGLLDNNGALLDEMGDEIIAALEWGRDDWAAFAAKTGAPQYQDIVDAHQNMIDVIESARVPGPSGATADAAEEVVHSAALATVSKDPYDQIETLERIARQHEEEAAAFRGKAAEAHATIKKLQTPEYVERSVRALEDGMVAFGATEMAPEFLAEAIAATAKVNSPEDWGVLMRAYDTALSTWKRFAILSPGFHFRNSFGIFFNNYLAGVDISSYVKFWYGWTHEGKDEVVEMIRRGGVVGKGQVVHESQVAEHIAGYTRFGVAPPSVKNPIGGANPFSKRFVVTDASRRTGEAIENMGRGALAYDVMRKAQKQGRSLEDALASAMDAVSKYHFDYDDLSQFERNVARRVIPFYTWTRKNLPLQLEMMAHQPGKYVKYLHAQRNLQLGTEEEDIVPSFFGELNAIRLPATDAGGSRFYLAPDLPFQQITKTFDPGQALASASPAIKTPLELWANKQFFSDIPLQQGFKEAPNSWGWMMPVLGRVGLAQKDRRGRWMMRDEDAYKVEQAMPVLGRARRLAPSEERYQSRVFSSWLSFGLGIGLRSNTPQSQEAELRRRAQNLGEKVTDQRALGGLPSRTRR